MAFQRIGLIGRAGKASVQSTLCQLSELLLTKGYDVQLSTEVATLLTSTNTCQRVKNCPVQDEIALAKACDLLIVVGGDGSILQSAHSVAQANTDVAILGINRGRLGFLADIRPDELADKVLAVLGGAYELDERFMLAMQIVENGTVIHQDVALNDIVLHAGKSVHTIDYQLVIDGVAVYRHHADGLIVATPTGSTAYSLSAGGPIVHPSIPAICLAPMHPHTLSSRPILVSDNSLIELKIHKDNRTQPMVSADGKNSVPLNAEQTLIIKKSPKTLTLLHPVGFDFYGACRTKLNWSLYPEEFSLNKE